MHRPDDNEPASYEWLIAVGFMIHRYGGLYADDGDVDNQIRVNRMDRLYINGEYALTRPTRRQVRLLCEALGIELRENKE